MTDDEVAEQMAEAAEDEFDRFEDRHDGLPHHNLFRCSHPDCRRDAQVAMTTGSNPAGGAS